MTAVTTRTEQAAATSDGYTVVKAKHPGRWLSAVVIIVIAGLLLRSVITNPNFGWDIVGLYLRDVSIGRGILVTLGLTAISMAIGIVLGVIFAVMRLSANPIVRSAAFAYVNFFRGTPVLVQLLFWFNLAALYPVITLGIPGVQLDANQLITPMTAAILGLGLNQGAYMSEIVRAGILSVDHGQTEAAEALGITRLQTMRRVVLPQAMRVIIPPTGNETIGMLKTTALVSVISVPELLYSAQIIYARTFETVPLLIVASLWYLLITSILTVGQYYLERRFARGNQRNLPPTPLQQLKRFFATHDALSLKGGKK
ncbi:MULTISPECIES: amino acid ABC transporter permease [Crystallibacter]|uniref:amino acid ABC transporter permease n=1 Tax=Crystallibacter TaxID=3456524 RepID=UPI0014745F1D|nr:MULTISPECIES: amino acid ABC transporter permease [unclassified Arthrobacter]MCW2134107.1 amino acid ABC transporter membrane protein, PAAT family [Arthrobacter sp. VKM Ac-2550]NMR28511.1 amino acid ABC transporter permease [Arthrobacter sp. SF27]